MLNINSNPVKDGNDTPVKSFTDFLLENKLTVSVAESCTSGLVAKILTDRSGSSAYFWGGVASYDNTAKVRLLNVKEETLKTYGAVSEQTAIEMATGIRNVADSDLAISLTGIAGPGGAVDGKPVGTVYIGLASKKHRAIAIRVNLVPKDRDDARRRFASAAISLAMLYIQSADVVDIDKTLVV